MFKKLAAVAMAISVVGAAGLAEAADAKDGKKVFRKCRACHVVDKEQNRVGPHLNCLIGRNVAAVDGFNYSDAMVAWGEGKTWTEEMLAEYLEKPRDTVKGTKMAFAGLKKAEDRANVAAYVASECAG